MVKNKFDHLYSPLVLSHTILITCLPRSQRAPAERGASGEAGVRQGDVWLLLPSHDQTQPIQERPDLCGENVQIV